MTNRKSQIRNSYEASMCDIFRKWLSSRNGEMGDLDDCYEFARQNGLYQAPQWSERRQFKMEMSRSISRERIIDEDGTPIRRNHVLRIKSGGAQMYLWGELMTMSPSQVKLSLKQRVHGLGNRAVQIDRDKTYYNDHNSAGAQIDLDYNLNSYVADARHSTEYPDERPDEQSE